MFPPKNKPKPLIIYKGHKISIGIQLVVDGDWRYKLQNDEQLTVQLRTHTDTVALEKVYTVADVDDEDKIVNVTLTGSDTDLAEGEYYLAAFVDDYLIFEPEPVEIRKVVQQHESSPWMSVSGR